MKVLLIDNFDSFTYNLFHYVEELECEIVVKRNDAIDLAKVANFDKIIISPGPGLPKDSGVVMDVIAQYHSTKPILGVCLGLQALGEFFGGTLYNLNTVKHGESMKCNRIGESILLNDVTPVFEVGLYHSWALKEPIPAPLKLTAKSENDVVMAFEHSSLPIYAVQFHPESVMTKQGKRIIKNFIEA